MSHPSTKTQVGPQGVGLGRLGRPLVGMSFYPLKCRLVRPTKGRPFLAAIMHLCWTAGLVGGTAWIKGLIGVNPIPWPSRCPGKIGTRNARPRREFFWAAREHPRRHTRRPGRRAMGPRKAVENQLSRNPLRVSGPEPSTWFRASC